MIPSKLVPFVTGTEATNNNEEFQQTVSYPEYQKVLAELYEHRKLAEKLLDKIAEQDQKLHEATLQEQVIRERSSFTSRLNSRGFLPGHSTKMTLLTLPQRNRKHYSVNSRHDSYGDQI